jgi:hypothetical protein
VPLGDLAAVVDAAIGAGRGRPSRPDRSASRLSRLLPALAGATVLLIVLPSIVLRPALTGRSGDDTVGATTARRPYRTGSPATQAWPRWCRTGHPAAPS